jgi:hypothetical protein
MDDRAKDSFETLAARTFGDLKIEAHPLAVDQHRSRIDQLLPGAVVGVVTAQRFQGKEKRDRFRSGGWLALAVEMDGCAEADYIELGILFRIRLEVPQQGPDEMRDVFVEGHRRQPVARRSRTPLSVVLIDSSRKID